jgi:SAM-dependent methyltransferase
MRFPLRKIRTMASKVGKPAITRDDVISAYRFILGREPESESVVQSALAGYQSHEELRQGLLRSEEFAAAMAPFIIARRFPHDMMEGPEPVEVQCQPQTLAQLLAHVEGTWHQLGTEDPYWSVLTADEYRVENFAGNQERFWASGQLEVIRMGLWLKRNRIELPPSAVCLEYGCGTGRMTRWLAREFGAVIACDISAAHLEVARQAMPAEFAQKVAFKRVDRLAALDDLPPFDLLFSVLVLQHNPPPVIAYVLAKLLARLRPGGFAYFQVPTFRPAYRFEVAGYLSAASAAEKGMEMHILPQREVFQIAAQNGCRPLEVGPDNMAGSLDYVSTTFLLKKA